MTDDGADVLPPLPSWMLITSHGLVLLYLSTYPDATIREVASTLELTERRVGDIIRDLSNAGMLDVRREGRRNHYALKPDARFRHPFVANVPFEGFVSFMQRFKSGAAQSI